MLTVMKINEMEKEIKSYFAKNDFEKVTLYFNQYSSDQSIEGYSAEFIFIISTSFYKVGKHETAKKLITEYFLQRIRNGDTNFGDDTFVHSLAKQFIVCLEKVGSNSFRDFQVLSLFERVPFVWSSLSPSKMELLLFKKTESIIHLVFVIIIGINVVLFFIDKGLMLNIIFGLFHVFILIVAFLYVAKKDVLFKKTRYLAVRLIRLLPL